MSTQLQRDKSQSDREQAAQELIAARDTFRVRGHEAEDVQIQAVGNTALKLRIGLPPTARAQAAKDPALDLQVLLMFPGQLPLRSQRRCHVVESLRRVRRVPS
jgi:hypothetical protein